MKPTSQTRARVVVYSSVSRDFAKQLSARSRKILLDRLKRSSRKAAKTQRKNCEFPQSDLTAESEVLPFLLALCLSGFA